MGAQVKVEEQEKEAPKMVRMWVTRQQVPIYQNKGFVPVAGKGPNGHESMGDSVLMEISADLADERRKQIREPYEHVRNKIRRGESPVGELNSPHAEFVFRRSKGMKGR